MESSVHVTATGGVSLVAGSISDLAGEWSGGEVEGGGRGVSERAPTWSVG